MAMTLTRMEGNMAKFCAIDCSLKVVGIQPYARSTRGSRTDPSRRPPQFWSLRQDVLTG